MVHKVEIDYHGRRLSLETGRLAKQAGGAVLCQYGETVVLATATASHSAREGIDFFPLTVDYQEKTFAAGKIPGGFFKREGRLGEKETLTSRLIDRPLRPLFPDGFTCETQIVATVLSVDRENDADMVAMLAASAALQVSDLPFQGPIAGVRMGLRDGQLIVNPLQSDPPGDLNLIVAGSRDGLVMVEGGAKGLPEDTLLEALFAAHDAIQPLFDLQDELQAKAGKPKRAVVPPEKDQALIKAVDKIGTKHLKKALKLTDKLERYAALRQAGTDTFADLGEEYADRQGEVRGAFDDLKKRIVRGMISKDKKRLDGRGPEDVRAISCEVQALPRTHGSAIFTRGETQALVVTTLGTRQDEQRIDALVGEHFRKFMLHYNFPPYSVGEVKFLRGPGRREVGHGALAERALAAVLPAEEAFPYTIRIVSEVLESNGSSSMASVCGGSLSMMDAGVPLKAPVAGIAMGLIEEGKEITILSDILGDEDHLGDMDFKVAGTAEGVTAVQMDIKIKQISRDIMTRALEQARAGRLHILKEMARTMDTHRESISLHAPRIETLKINPDKIRDLIGPGGKVIRSIVEDTGAKIDVQDDGTVLVSSADGESMRRAIEAVEAITMEAKVGKIYTGTVRRIVDFGAFVEILPGTDGLLHISQIGPGRVQNVSDELKEGDQVPVKVLEVDRSGKIRLSRKEALAELAGKE